jgi:hypothetical protein
MADSPVQNLDEILTICLRYGPLGLRSDRENQMKIHHPVRFRIRHLPIEKQNGRVVSDEVLAASIRGRRKHPGRKLPT